MGDFFADYRSPWMTEELDYFRRSVRDFFETEVAPHRAKWEAQQFVDRAVWKKAGERGFLCASVPEEYGGGGGSFAHDAIIVEEQARLGDTAFGIVLSSVMGVPIFLEHATDEQRKRWVPAMAAGDAILAFALTEPGAGSDAKNVATTAIRAGDDYVIDGVKTFISNGAGADFIVLVARTDPEADSKANGLSMFMVETEGLAGYRVGRVFDKIGQKGQDTAELIFENVRVPAANLIGGVEGRGFAQLMSGFQTERLVLGLIGVCHAERAIRLTLDHVKSREAFGAPLFELQNTRFTLAECATKTRIGRTFIDDCISRVIAGTFDGASASMAKYWCTDLQGEVLDACLQLHGGYGYMADHPIAQMYADARIQRIYGGANEIHKEVIARSL